MKNISDFVKKNRKKMGLTQEEFAKVSGLGLRFVRELERGKESVRIDKVNQALEMFGAHCVAGDTLRQHTMFHEPVTDEFHLHREHEERVQMMTRIFMKQRDAGNWKFMKVVPEYAFLNVERIHPLKQVAVANIVEAANKDYMIRRIVITGTCTTCNCDRTTPLAVLLEWQENCFNVDGTLAVFTDYLVQSISEYTEQNAVVSHRYYLQENENGTVEKRGVTVFERIIL